MNMHGMSQPGIGPGPGMQVGVGVSPAGMMQQNSPQQPQMQAVLGSQPPQMQQQQQQQMQAEKMDNISKIKGFIGPLRDSLSQTFKAAALGLQINQLNDNIRKETNTPQPRYEKHLEEFYSICDQIEFHLKSSIQFCQQLSSSQHYLPGVVANVRMEPFLQSDSQTNAMTYPQYLSTVRAHISSAKDIHDTLISAAQNISQSD